MESGTHTNTVSCPFCSIDLEYPVSKVGIDRLKLKISSHLMDYHKFDSDVTENLTYVLMVRVQPV